MAESETTYARRTEATLVTRAVRERIGVCVTARNLAETGEIEVSVPWDVQPDGVSQVSWVLEGQGYEITHRGAHSLCVAAMLW